MSGMFTWRLVGIPIRFLWYVFVYKFFFFWVLKRYKDFKGDVIPLFDILGIVDGSEQIFIFVHG